MNATEPHEASKWTNSDNNKWLNFNYQRKETNVLYSMQMHMSRYIPIVQFLFQIYLHGWLGFQLARFIGVYQWFFKYLSACVDLKLQNKNYHHISRLQTKWIWTKEKKAKLKIKTNKKLFVIFSCLFAVFNFYHF